MAVQQEGMQAWLEVSLCGLIREKASCSAFLPVSGELQPETHPFCYGRVYGGGCRCPECVPNGEHGPEDAEGEVVRRTVTNVKV